MRSVTEIARIGIRTKKGTGTEVERKIGIESAIEIVTEIARADEKTRKEIEIAREIETVIERAEEEIRTKTEKRKKTDLLTAIETEIEEIDTAEMTPEREVVEEPPLLVEVEVAQDEDVINVAEGTVVVAVDPHVDALTIAIIALLLATREKRGTRKRKRKMDLNSKLIWMLQVN